MEWNVAIIVLCFCLSLHLNEALILEGTLHTKEDWIFLTRFCYRKNHGEIQFFFEYPAEYCCQELILYYDSQWPKVYPQDGKSCVAKRDVTVPTNRQTLLLSDMVWNSGCLKFDDDNGNKMIQCSAHRKFSSIRARWWYLVMSNCGTTLGLKLKYKLLLTNGNDFWTKHFSADEQNIVQTDIFFACVLLIIFVISVYVAHELIARQLFHTTYKIYMWVIVFEFLSILVNIAYYVDYGTSGKPHQSVKNVARGLHCISEIVLVFLLILLGKGFTVTRGRISPVGQVKLSVFCTFYAVAYVALFIYEAKAFDPGEVLYIYESPAGVGICILRIIAWLWFGYGVFFTLKNYRDKRSFYYPFYFFYSIWFLSGPIVVMVALYVISAHVRAQVMNAVDRVVACMACGFFVLLTRPSAANKNFPFHVRTSQIGILNETPQSNNNFEQHAYSPSDKIELEKYKYADMFAASNPPPSARKENEELSSIEDLSYQNYNRSSLHINGRIPSPIKHPNPERHIEAYKSPVAKPKSNLVNSFGEVYSDPNKVERADDMFSVMKTSMEKIESKDKHVVRTESRSNVRTPTSLFQASSSSNSSLRDSKSSLLNENTAANNDEKMTATTSKNSSSLFQATDSSDSDMSATSTLMKRNLLPSIEDKLNSPLPPLKGSGSLPPISRGNTLPPLKSERSLENKEDIKIESIA